MAETGDTGAGLILTQNLLAVQRPKSRRKANPICDLAESILRR
jgi:hypothetical protein